MASPSRSDSGIKSEPSSPVARNNKRQNAAGTSVSDEEMVAKKPKKEAKKKTNKKKQKTAKVKKTKAKPSTSVEDEEAMATAGPSRGAIKKRKCSPGAEEETENDPIKKKPAKKPKKKKTSNKGKKPENKEDKLESKESELENKETVLEKKETELEIKENKLAIKDNEVEIKENDLENKEHELENKEHDVLCEVFNNLGIDAATDEAEEDAEVAQASAVRESVRETPGKSVPRAASAALLRSPSCPPRDCCSDYSYSQVLTELRIESRDSRMIGHSDLNENSKPEVIFDPFHQHYMPELNPPDLTCVASCNAAVSEDQIAEACSVFNTPSSVTLLPHRRKGLKSFNHNTKMWEICETFPLWKIPQFWKVSDGTSVTVIGFPLQHGVNDLKYYTDSGNIPWDSGTYVVKCISDFNTTLTLKIDV